jgi:predicted small lipoprotein YifL
LPHLVSQRFSIATLAPVALAVIVLTLAGCGRRGTLEAPPGAPGAATSQSPGTRLTPGLVGSARQNPADRDPLSPPSRAGVEEDEPPIPAPDRPFILDAIL